MYELFKLLEEFYKHNKNLVTFSILFQVLHSVLETVIIPFILAGAFNNINNSEMFKMQLIKLVALWVVIKLVECLSMHFHNQIEPEISKFIIFEIINSVFKKYENENHITNVSTLIDKIHLIKKNIHDLTYIILTCFIPRAIVIFISWINFMLINRKLGITILVCVALQFYSVTRKITRCVDITYKEYIEKDVMYSYIEDLLSNINTVQSTVNGYDVELQKLRELTSFIRQKELETTNCINTKQYAGYATNIFIFSYIIYTIYTLYKSGELKNTDATTSILSVIGLFDNMINFTYFIPEFTKRLGVLDSNETFLKDLILKPIVHKIKLDIMKDSTVEFKNVYFKYPTAENFILKDFSMVIPDNKIISIYGQSGIGKTTFVKLMFGIEKPVSGTVYIGGKDIEKYKIRDIRKYVAIIDQNTSNLFNRTIIDNITYGIENDKKSKKQMLYAIMNIFDRFNLYDIFKNLDKGKTKWSFLDLKVGRFGSKLSGGQKKIVHLIRLELNPFAKIIIMDEPSNGLDINTRNNIVEYTKYLNSKGKTIIIITHDDYFKTISDKIIEFREGENPSYVK